MVIVFPWMSTTTRSHSTLNGRQRLAGFCPFIPTASTQSWFPMRRTMTVSPGLKPWAEATLMVREPTGT